VPLLTAALGLPYIRRGLDQAAVLQSRLTLVGMVVNLAVAILLLVYTLGDNRLVLQMGLWRAPFGITVIADGLSAIMLTLTAILAFATVLFAHGTLDGRAK